MSRAALAARINARLADGELLAALEILEKEEIEHPLDAHLQDLLERVYLALDDQVAAAAAHLAAIALKQRDALLLYNLATGYFLHGQLERAEKWYRVTLLSDPDMARAHQNLASILRDRGEIAAANQHLHRAYSGQWLFEESAPGAALTVLMTCAAGIGNVPTRYLLPAERYNTVKCMVEYADLKALKLPAHDVIFNVIGDPDCAAACDVRLFELLARSRAPLLNPPQKIEATRRDRLPDLLYGIDNVIVPKTCRFTSKDAPTPLTLMDSLAREGESRLILRPTQSHGGQGVKLAATAIDIERFLAAQAKDGQAFAAYATQFYDSQDAHGQFRKYRMIFIDGVPYPYHLAISSHWLVHYFSAQMDGDAERKQEEHAFLSDPGKALGAKAYAAIQNIGKKLDLAYAGVDFAVLPGEQVLVFEANATMLVHPERQDSPGAYKNPFIAAIIAAFQDLLRQPRTAKP